MKEFNLYLHEAPESALTTWDETEIAIAREKEIIDTTQVMLCTTSLFERGYRIFVHFGEDDVTEIKLGSNERTSREIRMGHNLPTLIVAGEFDKRYETNTDKISEKRHKSCLDGYLTDACTSCEYWRDGTPDENGNTSIGCSCPFPIDLCDAFSEMRKRETDKRD